MPAPSRKHVDLPKTPFMQAAATIVRKLSDTIPADFKDQVSLFLTGGAAVHVYSSSRVSQDMDAVFSHRFIVPAPIVVPYGDGREKRAVRLDTNYTDVIALLHPCWQDDALDAGVIGRIRVLVISPLDLAVSKAGRFAEIDRDDIRSLARAGLIEPDALRRRCDEALAYYVGWTKLVEFNIRDAVEIVKQCVPQPPRPTC